MSQSATAMLAANAMGTSVSMNNATTASASNLFIAFISDISFQYFALFISALADKA
jgi:hypothetical protein